MSNVRPAPASAMLLGLALSLWPALAAAYSLDPGDYVLVAEHDLNASRLTIGGGDVAVLDGVLSSPRALAARGSTIVARTARLHAAAVCAALHATTSRGGGPACGADPRPFAPPFPSAAAACGFPDTFPACDPTQPPVVVPRGATLALPPGTYGDVRVEGGPGGAGTLLLAGDYRLCNLRIAREGRVLPSAAATVFLAGAMTGGNRVRLGASPAGGLRLFVDGTVVRFARSVSIAARVCAPRATVRVGSRGSLEGRFVAGSLRLRSVSAAAEAQSVTTSTTTTTLPGGAQCGDGVVEGGEVCDGDVPCTSAGGSFLRCIACATFTSGPCTPPTTTTTLPGASGPRCGDGVHAPGEECDDGNTAACDGCSARCTLEVVGNGAIDCDEECDDGNTADCDGCDADGAIECGNGTIDAECGEVCDGADVGGRSCEGGVLRCAADCRSLDAAACPAATAPREVCGNCTDDDGNGLVDFEDPACCAEPAFGGTVAGARVRARRGGGTLLRLRGRVGDERLTFAPRADTLWLQARIEGRDHLLCARVPAGAFRARGVLLRFRDRHRTVATAGSLDAIRLRRTPSGRLRVTVVGRRMPLDLPQPGTLRVTLAFADAGPAARCAAMTTALRAGRRGVLRAP